MSTGLPDLDSSLLRFLYQAILNCIMLTVKMDHNAKNLTQNEKFGSFRVLLSANTFYPSLTLPLNKKVIYCCYIISKNLFFPLFTLTIFCVTNRKITNSPYCTYFYLSIQTKFSFNFKKKIKRKPKSQFFLSQHPSIANSSSSTSRASQPLPPFSTHVGVWLGLVNVCSMQSQLCEFMCVTVLSGPRNRVY